MKKIIMAAGIAASMLFATSAFAEIPNTITAEYSPTTGYITIKGATERATTTYLVISRGETEPTGAFTGTIDDTMIKQIDQVDGTSTVGKIYVGKDLPKGFYEVRMGGDESGAVYDTFEVGGKTTSTRKLGDVNNDTYINTSDVAPILNHAASVTELKGDDFKAADANQDTYVNTSDVAPILNYSAGVENTGLGDNVFIK